jgi:hypothetical protein
MKFKLVQKEAGKAFTVFSVIDGKGGVCGSVNVPNEDVSNFVKCWRGAYAAAKKPAGRAAIAASLLKGPRLSKAALLRGC